jgi:hypothetical protein
MPDFFDRLVARGAQRPGGGMSPSGHQASQAAVTLALPRLPGPYERPAAEPPDAFAEAVDQARAADTAPPSTARARPALGRLAGTRTAITPPPLAGGGTTSPAPGSATTRPGDQPPARPAPAQQALVLPGVAPAYLVASADGAAVDQASARARGPAAGRDQESGTPAGGASHQDHPTGPPPPPRTLAVPASAVRAARPAADDARTAMAQPPAPPPVVVRIGRIEVRNTSPDRRERQAKRRAGRAAPRLTLAQYLAAASGGRNGNGNPTGGGR